MNQNNVPNSLPLAGSVFSGTNIEVNLFPINTAKIFINPQGLPLMHSYSDFRMLGARLAYWLIPKLLLEPGFLI